MNNIFATKPRRSVSAEQFRKKIDAKRILVERMVTT